MVWEVPAMAVTALGTGFTFPLIWMLGASWGAPVDEVPDGSMTQAWPEEAGVNPDTVTLAGWLLLGSLLTMKRVRFPDESVAA